MSLKGLEQNYIFQNILLQHFIFKVVFCAPLFNLFCLSLSKTKKSESGRRETLLAFTIEEVCDIQNFSQELGASKVSQFKGNI